MAGRFIIAVVTTILEELALVAIVIWGLPQIGINIPLAGLIALMALLLANAVFFYAVGSRALRRKPVLGLGSAVGMGGKVVAPLEPDGVIRIGDELWEAAARGGHIEIGAPIMVVEQDGLKLTVVRKEGK